MYKLICILTDYFFSKKNLNNIYFIKCANHKIVFLLDFLGFIFFLSFLTIFIFTCTLNIYKSFFFYKIK